MKSEKARELILSGKASEGLKVDEWLGFWDCTSLKSFPQGLHVAGFLSLYKCTSLKSLPQGLHVDGRLFLKECPSLIIDHWDVQVGDVCWDEDIASRVPVEILPLMIAVEWRDRTSKEIYRRRLEGD